MEEIKKKRKVMFMGCNLMKFDIVSLKSLLKMCQNQENITQRI